MNPKVLSIFNNAKIFLSESELKELAICIDKEFGKSKPQKRKQKKDNNWTLEAVTERLLSGSMRQEKKRNND